MRTCYTGNLVKHHRPAVKVDEVGDIPVTDVDGICSGKSVLQTTVAKYETCAVIVTERQLETAVASFSVYEGVRNQRVDGTWLQASVRKCIVYNDADERLAYHGYGV